jgi:hypothetical protein
LKTRLLAGAGSLALAGSMIGVAAPAAHAQPTVIGNCAGQVLLATFYNSAGSAISLTDQTQLSVTVKTKLLKSKVTKTAIAGDCSSASRPGDAINPAGGLVSPLTPKAVAGKLIGNAGCATGPAAIAVDATAAAQWPLSGKVTFTMTQLNSLAKPWQIQLQLGVLGFDTVVPDAINLTGLVLKGAAVGADVGGQIWFNPAVLAPVGTGHLDSGYDVDLASAVGCQDGTPNNASIVQVLAGGGVTTPSGLGSITPGILFSLGQ